MNKPAASENGIHYFTCGSGTHKIVLLRGLARWSKHWLGFEDKLAALGFTVITIDNRGFGESSKMAIQKNATIHHFAEDVAQIISREAPGGAHIVGLSLGAMMGLALAAMKPQLVRSLTMVNSSAGSSRAARITPRALASILRAFLGGKSGYTPLAKIILGAQTPDAKIQMLAMSWQEIDKTAGVSLRSFWRQLLAARGFSGLVEMASVKCPVTIIKCEGDQFVDPRNSDFLHQQIKHSKIEQHPTSGHELAVEDPDWFIQVIRGMVVTGQ